MERDRGNGGKSKEHLCQLGRNRATDGWAKQVGRHAGILRPLVAPKALSLIHRSSPRRHDFFSLRTRTLLLRFALVSYFVTIFSLSGNYFPPNFAFPNSRSGIVTRDHPDCFPFPVFETYERVLLNIVS